MRLDPLRPRTLGVATAYLAFCATVVYLGFWPHADSVGLTRMQQRPPACGESVGAVPSAPCAAAGEQGTGVWDDTPGGAAAAAHPGPRVEAPVSPATGQRSPMLRAAVRPGARSWGASVLHVASPPSLPGRTRGGAAWSVWWHQPPPSPWTPWGWAVP
jgi:hypothetical protein